MAQIATTDAPTQTAGELGRIADHTGRSQDHARAALAWGMAVVLLGHMAHPDHADPEITRIRQSCEGEAMRHRRATDR